MGGRGGGGARGGAGGPPGPRPGLREGVPLRAFCSLGVGGPAALLARAQSAGEAAALASFAESRGLPWMVLGKGSNCLFDDRGFPGLVIVNAIDFIEPLGPAGAASGGGAAGGGREELVRVGSGVMVDALARDTARRGLGGLQFAVGVPGTVGGAVYMNAGAHGRDTWGALESVEYVTGGGTTAEMRRGDPGWEAGYRRSPFQAMPGAAITAATLRLAPDPGAREEARRNLEGRRQTQPVQERSMGCVFRNPQSEQQSAGALIELAGLKGRTVGGAAVSEVHANYLINADGAASGADMLELMRTVQREVRASTGVELREEVQVFRYDDCLAAIE